MTIKMSVILPCRNEAVNIKKIVPAILRMYDKYIHEIIIVDDYSTDDTPKTIEKLRKKIKKLKYFRRNSTPGVGMALRDGIKQLSTKSSHVLFMDCDFIANIPDIASFIRDIPNHDGIIGSRFIKKKSLVNYPFPKLVVNRLYNFLGKILLGVSHSDLTNNFKLYRKDLVYKLQLLLISKDFAINAELGYYPVLMGFKIGEVAVNWQERDSKMGLSKFKVLKVGPSYFRIFLRLIRMKYTRH